MEKRGDNTLPEHDSGPFKKGEEKEIVDAVERFVNEARGAETVNRSDEETYRLSDAPPNLIRRFLLRKPDDAEYNDSWIPWDELPRDIFWRANNAYTCYQKISQEYNPRSTEPKGKLTVEDIQEIYERVRSRADAEFDLNDVYICAESWVLCDQWGRDNPDPRRVADPKEVRHGKVFTEEDFKRTKRVHEDVLAHNLPLLKLIGQALVNQAR